MTDTARHARTTEPDTAGTVRFEERLHVDLVRVPTRIARLQKFVVTERRTITVDVRHEEVRVVYEDVVDGAPLPERSAEPARPLPEVVLSEEQVQIRTVTVPVERARLVLETVTEQVELTGEVRSERVEVIRSRPVDGDR